MHEFINTFSDTLLFFKIASCAATVGCTTKIQTVTTQPSPCVMGC